MKEQKVKILLIGGGSGGHIIPLLAAAHELKKQRPNVYLAAVCETGSKFKYLYEQEPDIEAVYQIPAGKYRRYAGYSLLQKAIDVKTLVQNGRDVFRTLRGYRQAIRLLKREKPDILLIKGGFVAVPLGLAAARLGIPFITHDSDSTPGLANRIISKWALVHATGMPAELYNYPEDKTVYTGIPVSPKFVRIDDNSRQQHREKLGLGDCQYVLTVVGGSQGGEQLNNDFIVAAANLMERYEGLGIVHIAGEHKRLAVLHKYNELLTPQQVSKVLVKGFVNDVDVHQGAADIVVTRAGATQLAELSLQALPIIIVPGKLAGAHQDKNAQLLADKGAALQVLYGDSQALQSAVTELLDNSDLRSKIAQKLHEQAKPEAASSLAKLTLEVAEKA